MNKQHLIWSSVLAVGAVFFALTSPSVYGQEVLVIEGGTVIDGTGSAPKPIPESLSAMAGFRPSGRPAR